MFLVGVLLRSIDLENGVVEFGSKIVFLSVFSWFLTVLWFSDLELIMNSF